MPALPRPLLLAAAGLAAVTGIGWGASSVLSADRAPRGVAVAGADLSGQSRAEASATVRRALQPQTAGPVALEVDGVARRLDPAASGLSLDLAATVDEALGGGPLDRLRGLLGAEREVEPVPAVDEDALRAAVSRLKASVDRPPQEGAVRFRGADPYAVPPTTGRDLDLEGTVDAVADAWLRETGPVDVPVEVTPVRSTGAAVLAALKKVAEPAVAAPVAVDVEGRTLVVQPEDLAAGLRLEATATGAIPPRLDGEAVLRSIGDRVADVQAAPRDARIVLSGGRPEVVPAVNGKSLRAPALAAALLPVLTDPPPRKASVKLAVEQPDLTTAEARALRVVERVSSYTTRHPCCAPRVQNIHRIADVVDGTLVLPGERFDLNEVVGRRDRARGFVEAPQILRGEFVDRVGGGVSQFATTLFNAVFFAGLKDVEHVPHSYWIRRYPPGREATVSFPAPDLVFENDSPHGILIDTSYTDTSITVTFWGTKRYEIESVTGPRTRIRPFTTQYVQRDDCTATAGEEGFDITVTRVFKQGGAVVRREPFFTRYKPEPRFICGPPPAGAPAPPSPSPG